MYISGYRTPSTDASPAAPNAANAAPLMPVCDTCGGTGIDRTWNTQTRDLDDTPCRTCSGTGRLRATREGFPDIIRPGHLGADEALPAYAWPGGYPLVYLDRDTCVCCADCATIDLHNAESDDDGYTWFSSAIEYETHDCNLTCDACNEVISYQSWCSDCNDSVDCDEDNPTHLCPATEPYTVRYLTHVPGDHWQEYQHPYPIEGPTHAASISRNIREQQLAAFVHYQPSRLDFPPVVDEED